MPIEIERKFLVKGEQWRSLSVGKIYRQGYIVNTQERTVRVRVVGEEGYLTIKGPTINTGRSEFEYPIPVADAEELLNTLCDRPFIEKTRSKIAINELTWEIDEFWGDNQGLIVAEVELQSADQIIDIPDWIGEEVTQDARYYNANLVKNPFKSW